MAAESLRPIRRAPLYREVAEQIRDFIQTESLAPGDRLPAERELASRLAVSRTSVRQALTALQTIGLVEARHGDGVYVRRAASELQPEVAAELLAAQETLPQIMETREALETAIARLAASRRTPADLRELRSALREMAAAIEAGCDSDDADERFHAALAEAAANPVLADLMRQLAVPIALTRRASLSRPSRPAESLAGHVRIFEAVRAREPDAAGIAMREHLSVVAQVSSP